MVMGRLPDMLEIIRLDWLVNLSYKVGYISNHFLCTGSGRLPLRKFCITYGGIVGYILGRC